MLTSMLAANKIFFLFLPVPALAVLLSAHKPVQGPRRAHLCVGCRHHDAPRPLGCQDGLIIDLLNDNARSWQEVFLKFRVPAVLAIVVLLILIPCREVGSE